MDNHKIKELVDKYLAGTATAAELFVVESWMESLQCDGDDKISEQEIRDNSETLANKIIANTPGAGINDTQREYNPPIPFWRNISKVAVLLIVFSLSALVYFKIEQIQNNPQPSTGYDRYYTAAREVKQLTLPDSTIVYLNANSVLEIQRDFTRHSERRLRLNGEAFFEVKKDRLHPFKIQVGGLQVKVLGTSFNISGHRQLDQIKVAVKTGNVQVNKKHVMLAALAANQELVFDKGKNSFQTFNRELGAKALWREGVSILDNGSFEELNIVMSNVYGIVLKTTDKQLLKGRYNFTVRTSRTLEQSLGQLCEMMNKKYRKEGGSIIIF